VNGLVTHENVQHHARLMAEIRREVMDIVREAGVVRQVRYILERCRPPATSYGKHTEHKP
jgi:hypothetical protein